MRFSIIIPTFNRASLVGQAIESALSQTHGGSEIIVVDDGSSDETQSVVEKYGAAVRYLRQVNSGKAAALNLGMNAAEGDVFVVLDDDDVFPTSAVASHARALRDNPTAGFSYGRYASFEGQSAPTVATPLVHHEYPNRDPRRLVVKLMEHCFLSNPSWAVRREVHRRTGPYNTALHRSQDFDMILRLARANAGAFVDEPVFLQRTHSGWRGPLSDRTFGVHTLDGWIKYNKVIFEEIDRTWRLSDFAPFAHDSAAGPEIEAALPWLQKGVILFLRKQYAGADTALKEYRERLGDRQPSGLEVRIASGLLNGDYGINELLTDSPERTAVARALRDGKWPLRMRMAFASNMRWRVRKALTYRNAQAVRSQIAFLSEAFGGITALAALAIRLDASAQSWRGDVTSGQGWQPLLARSS
jgi:glycosyltransferase involved in cell wall biosynthesis